MQPKVTIVTVVYNAKDVIESTIQSIVGQTYDNLEYIVVDGASTDGTQQLIKKYLPQIGTYISEADKGVYDAMNKGIMQATGDWILFMNAGDTFYSSTSLSDFFAACPEDIDTYTVLYGDAEFRLKHIAYISIAASKVTTNEYMPFSHQAAFTKVDVAKATQFDLTFRIAADTAFFLRLIKEGYKFVHVPITVCSYNALEGLSAQNEVKRSKEIVALQAKWNEIDPQSPHFKSYVRSAKIKQFIRKALPQFIWIKLRERSVRQKHPRAYEI